MISKCRYWASHESIKKENQVTKPIQSIALRSAKQFTSLRATITISLITTSHFLNNGFTYLSMAGQAICR